MSLPGGEADCFGAARVVSFRRSSVALAALAPMFSHAQRSSEGH